MPAPECLGNDTDVDSQLILCTNAVLFLTASWNGAAYAPSGSVDLPTAHRYTPASGYDGPDTIIYKSDDGLWVRQPFR